MSKWGSWAEKARQAWNQATAARDSASSGGPFTAEEEEHFIGKDLLTYVLELAKLPATWTGFPMITVLEAEGIDTTGLDLERKTERLESPVPLLLSSKQVRHAQLILERSKQLSKLRNDLCPRHMDDDVFWKVYFLLVRRLVPLPNYDMRESAPSLQRSDSATAALLVDWNVADDGALRALCEQHTLPSEAVRRAVYARLLRLDEQPEQECDATMQQSYQQRFGVDAPQEILFPPRVNRYARTEDMVPHTPHRDAAMRIVACMALEQYASPQLPYLVHELLSLGFSEARVYCHARKMATTLLSLDSRSRALHHVDLHLLQAAPDVHAHLQTLGLTGAQLLRPSFHTLFGGKPACIDRLLLCGWHSLSWVLVAMVVLLRTKLVNCFRSQLFTTIQALEAKHWKYVLPAARALAAAAAEAAAQRDDDRDDAEQLLDATEREEREGFEYSRMRVLHRSNVIGAGSVAWEVIHSWLPARYQLGHTFHPVYSTLHHGTSLRTMYANAKRKKDSAVAFLLLVSTTAGAAFGAYLNCAPYPREDAQKTYGSGECFLFQLSLAGRPSLRQYAWTYTAFDTALISTTNEGFSLGGNALYIDNELRNGISRPCPSFNLPHPLCDSDEGLSDGSWTCVHLELWELTLD